MNKAFFLQLVFNASLLLSLALIYELLALQWRMGRASLRQVPAGVVIGLVGVIVMLASWKLEPGIVFDTRSILIGVSGLYFGTVPTLVAMAITAAFRAGMGGAASGMGIAVIITSGTMGIAWRHMRRSFLADITWRELYVFGLIIHLGMLACTILLPAAVRWRVFFSIYLSVVLIYPVVTALLGMLLADHLKRERTKQRLLESEERYQNLAKIAPVGIFRADETGATTYVNPMWCRISGLTEAQALGDGWLDAVNPDDRESLRRGWQETIRLEKPSFSDYRFLRPDGTVAWVMGQATPELNSEGKIVGYIGTITDISERTRAEDLLRKSEENFRRSLDDSPLGGCIVTIKGETIYANRTILDFYGYDGMDEINRIPIKERYTPQSYAEFQKRKKDRERGDFGPSEYEINIVRKNGEIRHLRVLRKEVFWNGAKQFQVIYQDITEHKRAEQALRESEVRYRAFFDTSRDCVFITTVSGRWLYMNDAAVELFGYASREELSQMTISDHYASSKERAKYISVITKHGYTKEFPVDLQRKDGTIIHALITAVSQRDTDGNVTGFQGTIRDVTERRRAEEVIHASLVEKEILLKEVHHRVKNNLMTIIGLIKMQETKANNKIFNPLLQELEGRVRAMALVHDSLHKSEDLARIDLQNYIETMTANIRAQFVSGCDTRFSVQAAGVEVGLDIAVPCGLILNELITNAYKHAFPGGRPRFGEENCEIVVTVTQEGDVVILSVADNGVGLPMDLDLEKTDTLGLRLVKMLSKQINGSLELDRSAGTVFRLKFPVAVI